MKSSQTFAIALAAMQFVAPLRAADVLTSIMSPVVSYQYPNDFLNEALASGGIASPAVSYSYPNSTREPGVVVVSPIASYQYLEWPGDDLVAKQSSSPVSYYWQFMDAPQLSIVPTFRLPTVAETTPALVDPFPSLEQLETFEAGRFTSDPLFPFAADRMTVVPLLVPTNAVAMSFDFKLQGDWKSDSLTVALNGTNAVLLAASTMESNELFSSGPINVVSLAGQPTELFIGIVGGTSMDAQVTVLNVRFHSPATPSLSVERSADGVSLSWALWAFDFDLETIPDLSAVESWTTIPNPPKIANTRNLVLLPTPSTNQFFRLKR